MGLRRMEVPGCQFYEVLPAFWGCYLPYKVLPASLEIPRLKTKPCLFAVWTGLDQARLGVVGGGEEGCCFLSLSGCGHRALVRAAHLRNGELGRLRSLISAKVNHCATLGYVVHPEAFK